MKLTVLGRHGPFPAPGGACSGYLVQTDSTTLVIDLGSGTLSNLRRIIPELKVDAVLLSHLHSDHMGDMLILRYALPQFRARGIAVNLPLPVIAPETPETEFRELSSSGVYEMTAAKEGLKLRLGDINVAFYSSSHPVETYAIELEHEGKRIFYTGDTGLHPALVSQCKGADILLADTCFLNSEKQGEIAPHLTAGEAGMVAKEAKAGQLICSHLWGGVDRSSEVLAQAKEHFPNTLIAEEMHEYHI